MQAYDLLLLYPENNSGHGLCRPFCPNRVLKEEFLRGVLAIVFRIILQYNRSYRYWYPDIFQWKSAKKNLRWVDQKWKPLTWSLSPWENRMIKIKNFHGVVQSSNMFEAGLKHVKLWQVNQQIYLGLIFKRNLEKIQLFVSIRLYLVFDFNAGTKFLSILVFETEHRNSFTGTFYVWKCLNSI